MTWLPYAVLLLVFKSSYILYRRLILRDSQKLFTVTAALTYIVFWGCSLIYALISGKIYPSTIAQQHVLPYIIGGGVLFGFVLALENYVISQVDGAQFSIISKAGTIFTVISGFVILGESLSLHQLLGGATIFIAALMVLPKPTKRTTRILPVTWLSLVYVLLGALAITNEKFILGKINMPTYMVYGWGAQTICLWLLSLVSYKHWAGHISKAYAKKALLSGFLIFAFGVGWLNLLVKTNNLPLASLIDSLNAVLVVLGSYFLLKERERIKIKVFATVIGLAGLLAIIF